MVEKKVLVRPQDVTDAVCALLLNLAEDVKIYEVPGGLNYVVEFPMFCTADGYRCYGEHAIEQLVAHQGAA